MTYSPRIREGTCSETRLHISTSLAEASPLLDASSLNLCKHKAVAVLPTWESARKEEAPMAVGVLMEFPGVTWEQYEQLEKALGLSGQPEGELIHVCGPTSDGGWRTVDVWESQEAFERFANELLIPQARAVGFPQPSKREFFEPFHAQIPQ